ncbi:glycoside hydrolase family 16 protein [Burkholderia sp. 500H]|nr:glycoside hydrolase family 16 protein [Burkholderia orbicola]
MSSSILPAVIALLAATTAAAANGAESAPLDLCGFVPIFNENFSAFRVSPRTLGDAQWIAHTPWNGDFGDAAFSDPGPQGPFSVVNGELHITASRTPQGRWHSGLIAAADASGNGRGVRYGYFEARMKLPPGPGTWPAFWLMSLQPVADAAPRVEIDVVEYYGHAVDRYSSSLHVWYRGANRDQSRHITHRTPVPADSLVNGYHDYGVRVLPDKITYYLDRRPVWEQATPAELDTPLYPLVNLALGSGYPIDQTPEPSTLAVKWIRLYALGEAGRSNRCARPKEH